VTTPVCLTGSGEFDPRQGRQVLGSIPQFEKSFLHKDQNGTCRINATLVHQTMRLESILLPVSLDLLCV